jgi:dTDP-4-dehydrorhamnose 3,5-epimerase
MLFEEGSIAGAFVIRPERRVDDRGFFARIHCEKELADHKLEGGICQINTGFSPRAGTLRGMHYQIGSHAEVKIMRCVRGAAFDVVIDLRPESPTFAKWFGAELTAESGLMLYAPAGTAHGYLTLSDDTELLYMTNRTYAPEAARGVRFDDPAFRIVWPAAASIVSVPDRSWPLFSA